MFVAGIAVWDWDRDPSPAPHLAYHYRQGLTPGAGKHGLVYEVFEGESADW